MRTESAKKQTLTNDFIIRAALKTKLKKTHSRNRRVRIIEELGVAHGTARIDIAVVNGVMHGYEIKSDLDTLCRLPEQMSAYNAVFDKITLVVGKGHLFEAISLVPDWWDIWVAKLQLDGSVIFHKIREGGKNQELDCVSIARLLWREEAIRILEEAGEARGYYSKSRDSVYRKLSTVFDHKSLSKKVRETLFLRSEWRPESPLMTRGG